MKYWMTFYDNNQEKILSISDTTFIGRDVDISEIQRRFINDFTMGNASMVKMSFLDNRINKSFIAGLRKKGIVIIDMDTKREFSTKEFNKELDILEEMLEPREPINI
jgi:hypothetical protein